MSEPHPLSPLLLLAVDVGVGGALSHVAHALAGLPPSAVGAASALLVGVTLRFAGPTVDHHGVRFYQWATGAHRVPKGLARCVLIVEDHDGVRTALAAVLRAELDLPVHEARTAIEGRGMAQRYRPAAIFCDLALPDEHGDEMLSAIGRPGVVLMSGAAHPADLDAAAKRCHAVPLAKPLDGARVVAEARRMLDAATA